MMYNITTDDYSIVESNKSEFYGVKLSGGKYNNVIVIYGQVGIKEEPELDQARLSFNYTLQDPGELDSSDLDKDEYFKNYLGAILQHIINDTLEHNEQNNVASIGIGNNESNTDPQPEPSSS